MTLDATYDPLVDALYLRRVSGVPVDHTVEGDGRVLLDLDHEGLALGVELLSASRLGIPVGELARALGEGVNEQEVADAAHRAIRGRPAADAT